MSRIDSIASFDKSSREVLQMWLRWNDGYQQITEQMFRSRETPGRLQEMLDDLDRLRLEAASATRQLLES